MHWLIWIIIIPLPLVIMWWFASSCHRRLDEWAKDNSYELISAKGGMLQRGPYHSHISNHQVPYCVEIRDANGEKKRGWALCSVFKVVDCIWDKEGVAQEWNEPTEMKKATLILFALGFLVMMGLIAALVTGASSAEGTTPAWYPVAQGCFLVLAISSTVGALVSYACYGKRKDTEGSK
jgi:hypothetical protein